MTTTVCKGQVYRWRRRKYVVKRVASDGTWADVELENGIRAGGWRQPLPFNDDWTYLP